LGLGLGGTVNCKVGVIARGRGGKRIVVGIVVVLLVVMMMMVVVVIVVVLSGSKSSSSSSSTSSSSTSSSRWSSLGTLTAFFLDLISLSINAMWSELLLGLDGQS